MSGFTPGPWKLEVGDHTHRYVLVTDEADHTIHYKYGSGLARDADRDEANAHLIAAAPELLEALVNIEKAQAFGNDKEGLADLIADIRQTARAAILKASPTTQGEKG